MRYSVLAGASLIAVGALAGTPMIGSAQTTKDKVEQKIENAGDKTKSTMERAGDKVQATGDKLQEKADRAGEKIKGTVDNALDKTGDKARAAGDKIEQKGDQATDKTKSMARDAGDKTKSMAREAKADVSDSWLTAKTKIALFADERVKGRQVNVETEKGVVFLRGKVDNAEAKSASESIAKGIDGVKSVKNELQVVAPTERAVVDASDKDVQKAVEARLAADPRLKKVDVRADSRTVTLTGEVPSIAQSARASELARSVPGVRAVRNDLTYDDTNRTMNRSSRPAAMGASQQHVRMTQEALKDNGYDPGPIDGVMGPQTAAAIKEYQQKENLPVTGRADAETLGRLGIGVGGASDIRKK